MSEGNGQFVLSEIRKNKIETPILFWTGKLDLEENLILDMGASSVISKLMPLQEFAEIIESHIVANKLGL